MLQPKQLLDISGRPALRKCLEDILVSGIKDVIAVIRDRAGLLEAAGDLPVRFAFNNANESEMADSLRIGTGLSDEKATGILICLCDHPFVKSETYAAIARAHFSHPGSIIMPRYRGRNGHPCLFPRAFLLKGLLPGRSLRDIVNENSSAIIRLETADEGVVMDIDTEEDYQSACLKKISSL